MLHGRYLDLIHDAAGRVTYAGAWASNTIVDSAWPLIAGLLRNDPALDGILFWAVGAGDAAWDGTHTAAGAAATRLVDETERHAIPAGDMVYLDEAGTPTPGPTTRLEVRAAFTWPEARTVREFGLFGGDATAAANSGRLINYVIHPRLDVAPGSTLTRRLRFTMQPDSHVAAPEAVIHWLAATPLTDLTGLGGAQGGVFAAAGITTLAGLAAIDPVALDIDVPLPRRVEMRARARLVLRTAARLAPVAGLLGHSAWAVAITPIATLAADAGVPQEQVAPLKEQVEDLAAVLSSQFLQGITIGHLAQPL